MSSRPFHPEPTSTDPDLLGAALTGVVVGLCLGGDWSRLMALLALVFPQ